MAHKFALTQKYRPHIWGRLSYLGCFIPHLWGGQRALELYTRQGYPQPLDPQSDALSISFGVKNSWRLIKPALSSPFHSLKNHLPSKN